MSLQLVLYKKLAKRMLSYARELPKPKYDGEFEEMCVTIYGEVFGDPTPKLNGRRGQKQGGIDILINGGTARIGVQCKRYQDGKLKFKDVEEEVRKVDAGSIKISKLIVATTAANDSALLAEVIALSDRRTEKGQFSVEIEFWADINGHVNRTPKLQRLYDPTAPGAVFQALQEGFQSLRDEVPLAMATSKRTLEDTSLPGARIDSVNNAFTLQIDAVNGLIERSRYREAYDRIDILGQTFQLLDQHQKARWYVQRAVCRVHLFGGVGAGEDLVTASQLYPSDDKIAAAGIRGLVLLERLEEAAAIGADALKRFPQSVHVWTALAYVRVELGEKVSYQDIPPEMVEEARALSMVCWALLNRGDYREANRLGGMLLTLNASLSDKFTALSAALFWAAEDPIARDFGFIQHDAQVALRTAVASLEPRVNSIWMNQSLVTAPIDASNLCYAYYLLDRFEDVLQTCTEAGAHFALPDRMFSLQLVALKALNRTDELLALASSNLDRIESTAKMAISEVAASVGDVELIRRFQTSLDQTTDGPSLQSLEGMAALALWNKGERRQAHTAALAVDWENGDLAAATIAARVLLLVGDMAAAGTRIEAVVAALGPETDAEIKLMAADCLYFLKRYREAARLYEPFCHRGYSSVLHSRLLRSYVESGQRAQAKALLAALPQGWTADDEMRETAIALAQRAGDWPQLKELSSEQLRIYPDQVGSWLLALLTERYGGSKHAFLAKLREVPSKLKGNIRQNSQLASLELQYGADAVAGLTRLYRMARSNLHEAEAAAAYIACSVLLGPMPQMADSAPFAGSGTQVKLRDLSGGSEVVVNIDPEAMEDLPPNENYVSPVSEVARILNGLKVGDTAQIPGQFGMSRNFEVVHIRPIFRALLAWEHGRLEAAPTGLPTMWAVNLESKNGELDITEMNRPGFCRGRFMCVRPRWLDCSTARNSLPQLPPAVYSRAVPAGGGD